MDHVSLKQQLFYDFDACTVSVRNVVATFWHSICTYMKMQCYYYQLASGIDHARMRIAPTKVNA
jgi:hypothetical protein